MEELIFRGAYVQRENSVSKSIGLASFLEQNLLFFLVLLCTTGNKHILEGQFNGKFFALQIWGAYINFGGAYFRNFTVVT